MRLQICTLAKDFDFSDGPRAGIMDAERREVVGTASSSALRSMFIAAPVMLAALEDAWDMLPALVPDHPNTARYLAIHAAIQAAKGA